MAHWTKLHDCVSESQGLCSTVSDRALILWFFLRPHLDDFGRRRADGFSISVKVTGGRIKPEEVDGLLLELAKANQLQYYHVNGDPYVQDDKHMILNPPRPGRERKPSLIPAFTSGAQIQPLDANGNQRLPMDANGRIEMRDEMRLDETRKEKKEIKNITTTVPSPDNNHMPGNPPDASAEAASPGILKLVSEPKPKVKYSDKSLENLAALFNLDNQRKIKLDKLILLQRDAARMAILKLAGELAAIQPLEQWRAEQAVDILIVDLNKQEQGRAEQ